MQTNHDGSYKRLFSNPEMVRDLIMGFIPDEWLHSLDYGTLEPVPTSFTTEDFQQRHDDVIWRVKVAGDWVYLYVLIEFQSRVETYMALRVLVYVGLLYQDLIKRGEVLSNGKLPPVLPIVLYNGKASWTAPLDVADLIAPVPGIVAKHKPHFQYFLVDENAYSDTELASLKNLVAAVFRLEHPASPAAIQALLTSLQEWLQDRPDLRRLFARWISKTLLSKPEYGILLPQVDDLLELKVMLAEKLEEWALGYKAEGKAEGIKEGLEKGMEKGEMLLLQKLLSKRFGPLSAAITAKIAAASHTDLELWFERALEAKQLSDVFELV